MGRFHCLGIEYCTDYISYKVKAPFALRVKRAVTHFSTLLSIGVHCSRVFVLKVILRYNLRRRYYKERDLMLVGKLGSGCVP
jgi:hypothetical protein